MLDQLKTLAKGTIYLSFGLLVAWLIFVILFYTPGFILLTALFLFTAYCVGKIVES